MYEPLDLVAKLAALIPRPHKSLVLYHGLLAANSSWRQRVVRLGRGIEREVSAAAVATAAANPPSMRPPTQAHDQCRKALQSHITLERILSEVEGQRRRQRNVLLRGRDQDAAALDDRLP